MRSPKAYEELARSNLVSLPTGRTLRVYKNSCHQRSGINPDSITWMRTEADRLGLKGNALVGGIILDEMSIQVIIKFF